MANYKHLYRKADLQKATQSNPEPEFKHLSP